MSFLLMIWRKVSGTAERLAHLEKQLAAMQKAIQDNAEVANRKLDQIIDLLTAEPADRLQFDVQVEQGTIIEGAENVTLSDSQRAQLSIRPVDRKGKPAPLDGPPTWATSDPTVATVTPGVLNADGTVSPDDDAAGLRAVLEGVAPGTCRVTVTGDANLTNETAAITGVLEVTVTAGQAITVSIDAGSPVETP